MRLVALIVLLAVPALGRPKKPPPKPPPEAPVAAPCPDGKPTPEEVDQFAADDEAAAKKVKAYARSCRAFAAATAKELYLRGYTLKNDKPPDAIALFKKSLELAPARDETADKARAQIARLEKGRRD